MTIKASQGDLSLMKRFMGRSQELANHIKDDSYVETKQTSNRATYEKINAKLVELVHADHIIGRLIKRVKDNVDREVVMNKITDETEATIILHDKMKELIANIRKTNAGNIVRSNGKLVIKSNGSNTFALLGLVQKYNISMNKRDVRREHGVVVNKKTTGNHIGSSEQVGHEHLRIMSEIYKMQCGICNTLMNSKKISIKSRKLHCCDECLDILDEL